MAKPEKALRDTEAFIREVMQKNFRQEVDEEELRAAAKKLRAVLPHRPKEKEAA